MRIFGLARFVLSSCLLVSLTSSGREFRRDGKVIDVVLSRPCRKDEYGEDVRIYVAYYSSSRAFAAREFMEPKQVIPRLEKIMETRNVKLVWFSASDDVDYGEVTAFLQAIKSSVPGVQIILLTEKQTGPIDPSSAEYRNYWKSVNKFKFIQMDCEPDVVYQSTH